MTNGYNLLKSNPEWIAFCIAEQPQACDYCAYRGGCDEGQPYYERTCAEGVTEWLMSDAEGDAE